MQSQEEKKISQQEKHSKQSPIGTVLAYSISQPSKFTLGFLHLGIFNLKSLFVTWNLALYKYKT